MEEKKLTDEEIIKDIERSTGIPSYWKNIVLDLIHRLQDEIKEYETLFDISNERKYRKMFDEEWKKEYQKELDKQSEGVIAGFPDFDLVYKLYFEQKAEIERLTEENAILKENPPILAGRSLGKTIRAKLLAFDKMKEQNAELQKQVDELKDICLDCPYKLKFDEIEKQAVKDTAKEILQELYEYPHEYHERKILEIAKRKGVEVE